MGQDTKRVKFLDLDEIFGRSGKGMGFLVTEKLKDKCICMFSGNSLNDKPN